MCVLQPQDWASRRISRDSPTSSVQNVTASAGAGFTRARAMPEVSFVSDLFAIDIVGRYYGFNSTMFYLLITRRPLNLEVLLSSCDS